MGFVRRLQLFKNFLQVEFVNLLNLIFIFQLRIIVDGVKAINELVILHLRGFRTS